MSQKRFFSLVLIIAVCSFLILSCNNIKTSEIQDVQSDTVQELENNNVKKSILEQLCEADLDFVQEDSNIKISLVYNGEKHPIQQGRSSYKPITRNELRVYDDIPENACKVYYSLFDAVLQVLYIVEQNDEIILSYIFLDESIDKFEQIELFRLKK